jgi:hypothetical protein
LSVILVPTKEQGNVNYPLPPDYWDLGHDAQRKARVNACRLWTHPSLDRVTRTAHYIAGSYFFDKWYLWPDEDADFNPMFYDDEPMETPDYHWWIVSHWMRHRKTITIAPRGGAKTALNVKDMMFRVITRPGYSFVYATSTHSNARDVGEQMKLQFKFNERLNIDWCPEMPDGRIVPRKTDATFSTEMLRLMNRSWIRMMSATTRQRGKRPRRYRLDDPEFDAKAATSMSTMREYMAELLFKIVLPMVTRPGTGVDWIGTYVSKRHYLWHATKTHETPEGERAVDPLFNSWLRLCVPAELQEEGDPVRISCWPQMWPATIKEKEKLAEEDDRYDEAVSLEEMEDDMGRPNYNSEMLAKPGDAEYSYFQIDMDVRGKHAYWYEEVDELLPIAPFRSQTMICWYEWRDGEPVKQRMLLPVFLFDYARQFICADTSKKARLDSDYKCCGNLAITPNNDLFVLDLWARKCLEPVLVNACFAMADSWRVPSIHPEVVQESISLFNSLEHVVKTKANDVAGTDHLPRIKELRPGMVDKTSKISAAGFRFDHNKIKLPLWKTETPPWRELFNQIIDFNPDVEDGGLEKDDHIDVCLAMPQFVIRGKLNRAPKPDLEEKSLKERLMDGDFYLASGQHVGEGLDLNALSSRDIAEILDARDAERFVEPSGAGTGSKI